MKFLVLFVFILCSCSAPRSIKGSGKVTPKGDVKLGYHSNANLPTQTTSLLSSSVVTSLDDLADDESSVTYSVDYEDYNKALIAYAIDPIGMGSELYANYGIAKNFELEISYGSSGWAYQGAYQFMGSTGTLEEPGEKGVYGNIALQYSSQDYELPSYLGKVQSALGFEFKRKDLLSKLRFSKSLGVEEKYGHLGYGLLLGYSKVSYGFNTTKGKIIKDATGDILESIPTDDVSYLSYGSYVNARLGYRWVYFLVGLAVYYQDYGEFKLVNKKNVHLKGYTFIPSFGFQITF